jgi:hypothetical protein
MKSDTVRQRKIEALGIRILTYTNGQIIDSIDDVLNDIISNLPLTPSFIRRGRSRGGKNRDGDLPNEKQCIVMVPISPPYEGGIKGGLE